MKYIFTCFCTVTKQITVVIKNKIYLATEHIRNRGLVGFAALVLVGQQFYRLFFNQMVNYTLLHYSTMNANYWSILYSHWCSFREPSFLKTHDLSLIHYKRTLPHCTTTYRSVHSTISTQHANSIHYALLAHRAPMSKNCL